MGPEDGGLEIAAGAIIAYGIDNNDILSTISNEITHNYDSITISNDVGSRMGDHFIVSLFVAGPPYAIKSLAANIPMFPHRTEQLRGVTILFLPQIDYRYPPNMASQNDFTIKLDIYDRSGIQNELLTIFKKYDLVGVFHWGHTVNSEKGKVYRGRYWLSLPTSYWKADPNTRLDKTNKTCEELRTDIKQALGNRVLKLMINNS